VFPLAVQARARTGDTGRGPVGLASTFVPWFPDGPIAPTRVAWVLPLVDQPRRAPAEAMLDDALDALLEDDTGRRGRLQRTLLSGRVGRARSLRRAGQGADRRRGPAPAVPCRGEPVPVTYALDPDLLYSVEAMSRPYTVLERGQALDRPRSDNAEQWLVAVRAAARESDVLALPYGDPDVVALSRTESPVKDDVEALRQLGQSEARRLLRRTPEEAPVDLLTTVAFPPPGPVEPVVDPLAGDGSTALLLDASALPPPPAALDRTPNARTALPSIGEPVTALVADPALSALVEPDVESATWQGDRLAEQRWLAETAVLAAERPGRSRTIVVAPRRQADLKVPVAIGALVDTGRVPWLCPVSLAAAVAGTERCPSGPAGLVDTQGPATADRRGAPRVKGPEDVELSQAYVRELAEVRADADQFTEQVLIATSVSAKTTKARLLRARGRAASAAWRERPAGGLRMRELLERDVDGLRSKIVLRSAPVLLTGRSGTVSLTVENGLDQPVTVGVGLDPTSAARLTSEAAELQEVPGRNAREVPVQVEARTSGRFTVQAHLVDRAGRPFGRNVELQVRSTQYGRVALAVTGVAAAVLLVAAGARITRRALRRPSA
jgi:hypothetical protein